MTVLQDVNIGVAAKLAAQVCGLKVGPVAVLGTARGPDRRVADGLHLRPGPVTLRQN